MIKIRDIKSYKAYEDISAGYLFNVGAFNSGNTGVHVFIHGLKFTGILFQFHELFFKSVEVVHRITKRVDHGST